MNKLEESFEISNILQLIENLNNFLDILKDMKDEIHNIKQFRKDERRM